MAKKKPLSTSAIVIVGVLIGGVHYSSSNTPDKSKVFLPLHSVTPGVLNTDVTQDTIQSTVCSSGWTATIRPTVTYTNNLKEKQLASDYKPYVAVIGSADPSLYEEDHLISLQLGGSPTDPKNLWPQPYEGTYGARKKDVVETELKREVCAGTITLATAQKAISSDWFEAYKKYVTDPNIPTTKEP